MSAATVLVAVYALALVGLAAGLHLLGGRSRKTPDPTVAATGPDWPRSEVPKLHTTVAMVAAGAAIIVPVAATFTHNQTPELVVLATASASGCLMLLVLILSRRRGQRVRDNRAVGDYRSAATASS